MNSNKSNQPLKGLRILDLCEGKGDSCGRYLADLGAEVMLIEPGQGSPARRAAPLVKGHSLYFATHAANKKSVVLDIAQEGDRTTFYALAQQTDILIHSCSETALQWLNEITPLVESEESHLITLAISDFGDSGPYAGYAGSNAVHMAMAGITARSGLKDREPLLPPGQLCYEAAAIQAAWVALVAYWQSAHTHRSGNIDFSVFEASCQILDPALGVTGSAAGGQSATKLAPRGRPPEGKMYPFFPCADGFVRICVLNPRQWQAMSAWLGDDHPYTDPAYANMAKRFKHMREINLLIEALFAKENSTDLVAEGQRRGVPIAAVATPQQVLQDHHFTARGAFTEIDLAAGLQGKAPSGYLKINGQRAGIRQPAPVLNEHQPNFSTDRLALRSASPAQSTRRPLEGIRVLDLGVIVAGAELGRLFADQGAEVIKVENKAYPDGLRQSLQNSPITESFAQGSRGKKSLGLNLRSEKGKQIFKELVAKSDVVLSNFKPGTMDSLGFGYTELKAINPRIIVSESSALGGSGPMSNSMGYGPLVRASSGLTGLWRYPEDECGFGDALTIFPDHLAARVSAVAILALLIEREKTGVGGTVSLSQAETILMTLSTELLSESLQEGWLAPSGNRGRFDAPSNLFSCEGDDEWCVIDIEGDEQWLQLCSAMGRQDLAEDQRLKVASGRLAMRDYVEQELSNWTLERTPQQIVETLQAAGIAAAAMARINELPDNPHLKARDFFRINMQPGLDAPLLTENGPAGRSYLPEPEIRPAPFVAEHTRELMRDILQLDETTIESLIESGDLEVMVS
ncbi:CaiB/BaiF CoA-transferase family protein [Zhongshania aliphaticivorans]|uniref:CaiB/BaiF CoA-transferase family protein n=1 Tax=Zhongshania aliphaticivorans TaxID=1470434 RepID=UPI0012E5D594|nr:CoA transferase [Zhongshania aliphaticivorans]CAA0118221.1 putative CoA-transferase [Zhongshania aliphaticivorans]